MSLVWGMRIHDSSVLLTDRYNNLSITCQQSGSCLLEKCWLAVGSQICGEAKKYGTKRVLVSKTRIFGLRESQYHVGKNFCFTSNEL